ncbi:MAG: MBL fold metallo-hydrolase, partial [Patescibacteria group bacterium]
MKLTFYGAAHEVTGSCYLLETKTKRILVDCGMFQGSDFNEARNGDPFPFDPKSIDAVLVTHAHIDHTGRIPKLVEDGFTGRVFMTKATTELAKLVWEDAYHIMEYNHRKFQSPLLWGTSDIAAAAAACHGVDYDTTVDLGGGVSAVWKDAGHIFGAAFIEVSAEGKTIAFSGDIGNVNVPILRDTEPLGAIDVLLTESTYGDREHEDIVTRRAMILELVKDGCRRGGTIMVPSFSIERTQEFLFELHKLSEHDKTLPKIPIFLDSPLAIDATKVFKKYPEYYDEEAKNYFVNHDDFLNFPKLQLSYTVEESKKINNIRGPKMVIAGSGMMNG